MKIIKLESPVPWPKPQPIRPFGFLFSGFLPLPPIAKVPKRGIGGVLEKRRSFRSFDSPLSFNQLASLIWHSARIREKRYLENGTIWQSRIAPSGGGCHPIHIVILRAPEIPNDVLVYDAEHNGFGIIASMDRGLLRKALKETEKCLCVRNGTVLWFLADVAKTGSKYSHPESLIWRDSGALLATISFVAEVTNLRSCGIGIHEPPSLRELLKLPVSVFGVGGCIISA